MTTESGTATATPLAGLRVLVVEDDYFIADEMCTALRDGGAEVVGPSPDLEHGLDMVKSERIDCAVLDINLHGNLAFDLASELRTRGTPSIFATGYDQSVLPGAFSDCVRLEKPINLGELLRAVQSVCTGKPARSTGTNH
jgi:DNA-binding response OmpR family regulator